MSRLDDLNEMKKNLDSQNQEIDERARKAEEERKKAEEEANKARKDKEKLDEAMKKYKEAEDAYQEAEKKYQEAEKMSSNMGMSNTSSSNIPKQEKNSNNVTWPKVTALVIAGSILTGAVVYALTRQSLTGKIANATPTASIDDTNDNSQDQIKVYENIELTEEKLRAKITYFENYLREFNLATSSEDIARFVVAVNINKIATDHPEYISQYVDGTNTDEFMQDVYQTLMDIITYNGNIYAKEGNTDHFIMADEAIFDEYSRDMLIEIENYFDELASETDDEKFNIKVNEFLTVLMDPTEELSQIESGIGFASYTSVEPIRRLFSGRLNEENAQLIKYFVPYAGDEMETLENCRHNGYSLNVEAIIKDKTCGNTKTLSK